MDVFADFIRLVGSMAAFLGAVIVLAMLFTCQRAIDQAEIASAERASDDERLQELTGLTTTEFYTTLSMDYRDIHNKAMITVPGPCREVNHVRDAMDGEFWVWCDDFRRRYTVYGLLN